MKEFKNITQAFNYLYDYILKYGVDYAGTKACFNIGFEIKNTLDRIVKTERRNFSEKYAEREWEWYESKNPNAEEISKFAPIWKNHMDEKGDVRSNYGHQVNRNGQWEYVKEKLKQKDSRHGVLSIYDGKENNTYSKDTPCTIALNFYVFNDKLNLTVIMRSNDLWFGLCNDFYCFTKFQEKMANELGIGIGTYYHFATNIHLYKQYQTKKIDYVK